MSKDAELQKTSVFNINGYCVSLQLEDVSDMERICKGRLCEAIATEIYEITRSLEQTRAQKCCHEEQPNGPVRVL